MLIPDVSCCCEVLLLRVCNCAAPLQVENQRRLRQLAEDEAQLTATQLQLQAERQAVLAAAGQAAIAQKAQEQQKQ
jgi:hypothetical protein